MEMLTNLKKLYLKGSQLCEDYSDSIEYEKCEYHLVETFESGGYGYGETRILLLIDTSTGKIVTDGNLKRIKSYINLRNIDVQCIYNHERLIVNQMKDE